MTLGIGYWSLTAVDRRISDLIKRKPRRWNKRLKELKKKRRQILSMPRPDKIVKGWKSYTTRKQRALKMRRMYKTQTYREIGEKLGVSRQRVHQIISDPQWRMYRA